jgi:hypothetical protein
MNKTQREKEVDFAIVKYAQILGLDDSGRQLFAAFMHRVYWAGRSDGLDTALEKLNEKIQAGGKKR